MHETKPTTRTAYIYSRVSKLIQAEQGQGLVRQQDKATQFITFLNTSNPDHQYVIADGLIIDKGLSAFYGLNTAENGGLGAFIAAAEKGEIPPYSLLVVENVDRISRLPADDARNLFIKLKGLKIDVAVTKFNLVISHDSKSDLASDLVLTVAFHLAHLESEQKSQRIRATFDIKRQNEKLGGERRTSVCPAWMKLSGDKKSFELIPEHATTIKQIFEWRIQGHGAHVICNRLNESDTPRPAKPKEGARKAWSKRMVEKYLKMPQTYGEFHPTTHKMVDGKRVREPLGEPIQGYYPAVVDKDTFIQAQQAFKTGRHTKGRRAAQGANLFGWLCKCPSCGESMTYFKPTRGRKKVRCRNQLDKNHCTQKAINYEEMETLLVEKLSGLDYSKLRGDSFEKLQRDIDLLKARIDEETQAINELQERLESASPSLMSVLISTVEKRTQALDKFRENHTQKLQVRFNYSEESLNTLELTNTDDRERYNKFLRQYIEYVLCGDESTGVVYVKLKQIPKILPFYYGVSPLRINKARAASEDVIKEVYTHNSNDIKIPFGAFPAVDTRLFEVGTVPVPDNLNDPLTRLKYLHAVNRELSLNPSKWKPIVEGWRLDESEF
ncbi:recombinase family protein [Vibrio methylphosphonaticus]|uniref:recombinase family protein n=1 Tax=Vibrio methylphosphonaticus TaxID=2946866 RepID=UPI00202A6870|nr:recombinase family protein [Vibrio methylphosphonaticus]MCL9773576.1 recombinase family protein [Vibrio methylphosphonaticus]